MSRAVAVLLCLAALVRSQSPHQNFPSDPAAVEQSLTQAVTANPSAQNWERLGLIRHLRNEYQEAIPAFREAIRLNGRLWTSHLFLGICLYRTNQFADALRSLETANRIAPARGAGRDDLDYWLGAAQIARNQPLIGLATLERLLARNPRHTDALELVVRTAGDTSTTAWNHVAETAFETAAGYEVHGHALESEGNRVDALEAFRRSKTLDPQRAGPGLAIGRLLLLDGKAAEALEVLRQEVSLPAVDPGAFYYAGLSAIQTGKYVEAAPWLESASRWPQRNPEARIAVTQVYLALNEPIKAAAAAQRAVADMPDSPAAHELFIAALLKANRSVEAEAEQRRWQNRR